MVRNTRRGAVRVDPATLAVTLDGEPVTCEPATDVPLSGRYLLG
jgi:urease subunit alpha